MTVPLEVGPLTGGPRPRPFRFALQAFETTSATQWRETVRMAEDLGFCTLFTTDHYFGPGQIATSSGHRPVDVAPLTAMATAAALTKDLRVGCRVFAADFHHPVVLAKELATLDLLSEGRLEIGLGAGWVAAEYEGLGIPMDRAGVRIERLAEVVAVLKGHFSGEPLDIRGTYVRATGFAGRPLPVQRPHPPLMLGGGSPRILRLAGALGDIVSINYNNASGQLGASSVDSSTLHRTEEKIAWIREGAGDRFDDIEIEIGAYFVAVSDDPSAATDAMATRFGVEPAELVRHPHALLGSVDTVCDLLNERRETLGLSYVTVAQRNAAEFAPVLARMAGT
jgi:probable F420-dependent oxidoreductase